MNILFIHANYPAQFRHLCQRLSADSSHNVVFLTAREDASKECFSGLTIKNFQLHRDPDPNIHHYLSTTEQSVLSGQAVIRALDDLVKSGFNPDLIITHAGNGLSLFIKDLLPNARLVGYFEWYFRPGPSKHLFKEFDFNQQLLLGMRNFPILQELEICDAAVVPTVWQKSQFPKVFHEKLVTIFDGIDITFFHPNDAANRIDQRLCDVKITNRETNLPFSIKKNAKIVSYATRGMEPLRGFPEFMRAMPNLLRLDKSIEVVIAGADRCAYSYQAPSHNGSWKNFLLNELGNFEGIDRISFVGLLDYNDYRNLLWRSDLHCYFTRPYVTSWSFFEACACGSRLMSNISPATKSIAVDDSVVWIDLDSNPSELADKMFSALNSESRISSKLNEGFSLEESLLKWQNLLRSVMTT